MRKKCSVFGKIRIEDYQVTFLQTIKSSKPNSILPVHRYQIESLQQRLRLITTLLRRVAIMRPCIKLHAEITENTRPQDIAANWITFEGVEMFPFEATATVIARHQFIIFPVYRSCYWRPASDMLLSHGGCTYSMCYINWVSGSSVSVPNGSVETWDSG